MARNESDSAWKDLLDIYLKDFFDYCLPEVSAQIDWLIGLPEQLELEYLSDVYQLEEATNMPYISTAERIGLEKGIEKEKIIVAQRLLAEGVELVFIAKITDLPLWRIKEIQEGLGKK